MPMSLDVSSALLPVGGADLDFNMRQHIIVLFRIYPRLEVKEPNCG
jgi:hypothetical protein